MILADRCNQMTVPLWIIGLMGACTLGVWVWGALRLRSGHRLLPRQSRRLPPWRLGDVVATAIAYVGVATAAHSLALELLDGSAAVQTHVVRPESFSAQHPIVMLLAEADPVVWLGCVFSVVVVAPVAEEFLFRLLLQGWLEAEQRRWAHLLPTIGRVLPGKTGPILLASLLFAMVHFHVAGAVWPAQYYQAMLLATTATNILAVAAAVVLLHWGRGAGAADLGWSLRRLPGDVRIGALVFAAMAGPIYLLQALLGAVLPSYLAPDPITLFPLSLVLGWLYARTKRLAPPVTVHALLNATSLVIFCISR